MNIIEEDRYEEVQPAEVVVPVENHIAGEFLAEGAAEVEAEPLQQEGDEEDIVVNEEDEA